MNNLSVFGGTGFIGGKFCQLYPDKVTLVPRDGRNPPTKDVLYFISTTTNQSVFKDLHVDIDTNLTLLMDVLSNCRDKDITFNFVSSCFVYGNDVLDAKETDCCNPTGFYSITKRSAEQLLISYCKTFDIKYRIFRIGNVYGLDPTITPGKNVLGYMIGLLKQHKDIKLFDDGDYKKDYMFVEDICRAIKFLIKKSETNQIYNVATGSSMTFKDILLTASDIVSSRSEFIPVPFPKEQEYLQVKNMTLNVDKLSSMGFLPKMSFDEGLNQMCEIY